MTAQWTEVPVRTLTIILIRQEKNETVKLIV